MLTPRESQVLLLICEGLENKRIGYALDIYERTVKQHVTNIMIKFGIEGRKRCMLVSIAIRKGLYCPWCDL